MRLHIVIYHDLQFVLLGSWCLEISPSVFIRWLQSWKIIGLIRWVLGPFMIFCLGAYRLQPKVTALTNIDQLTVSWLFSSWLTLALSDLNPPQSNVLWFFSWTMSSEDDRANRPDTCLVWFFLAGNYLFIKHDETQPGGNYYSGCNKYPFFHFFHPFPSFCFSLVSLPAGLISWPTGPRVIRESMSWAFLEQWFRKVCNLIATSVRDEILGSEVFIVDQWFWRGSNLIWHIVSICWISWYTTFMLYTNFTRFCHEFPGVQYSNESWNSTRQNIKILVATPQTFEINFMFFFPVLDPFKWVKQLATKNDFIFFPVCQL